MTQVPPETGARQLPTRIALIALPLALFLLALNPWFLPEQHDDVTYFFGAKSIAESGTFALDGTPITDWPPLFPLALAGARQLFGGSIWVAKLCVLVFVVVGVFLIRLLAEQHKFQFPSTIAALTCLLPISLICGANVLSEWPFLTLSALFFLALQRLDSRRTAGWILASGTLLALASLTRFGGVLLGAAIIAQAVSKLRNSPRSRLRAIGPEAAVTTIGAIPWLLWKLRCSALIARGEAPSGAYDQSDYYLDRFTNFDPVGLFSQMEVTLFSLVRAISPIVSSTAVASVVIAVFSIVLVSGAILHFRKHGIRPADWYVIASLLLLLGDLRQPERYFLPLAPFLIGYVLVAVQGLAQKISSDRPQRLVVGSIAAWCALLVTLDGYLLFIGNAEGSRAGLSRLSSPAIENFYKKQYRDLYQALDYVDGIADPNARIATDGFHGKYVLALTGRSFRYHPADEIDSTNWLVQQKEKRSEIPLSPEWHLEKEFGTHRVYRRNH